MSRNSPSRKRASRALIVALAGVIVVGSIVYFTRSGRTGAAEPVASTEAPSSTPMASPAGGTAVVVKAPAAMPTESTKPAIQPLVTMTPTGSAPAATPPPPAAPLPKDALALNTAATTRPATTAPAAGATPIGGATPMAAPLASSAPPTLAGAKAKADAGQMLAARNDYNAALVSGKLSPADATAAKTALAELNKTIVFSPRKFNDDVWATTYTVKSGDVMQKIARSNDVTWELLCRINGMSDPRKLRVGQTLKLVKGPFHAIVSKGRFTLDLYLGAPGGPNSLFVTSFPVGLGKDDSTPLGTWMVKPESKLKNPTYYNPREEGDRIVQADDPKNPLGEFWLGLVGIDGGAVGKESYGIHGTIEPESIGKMASLGCIRMVNENVEQVFNMLVETKSTVVVTD